MGKSGKKEKKVTKSHEKISLYNATHLIEKNSRTIMKLCQLTEIRKNGKELNNNFDTDGYVSRRIEKLKSRLNRRLVKLAKWVDHPDHEQLASFPSKTYSNRVSHSNGMGQSKSRSHSIPLPKYPPPSNRYIPPQPPGMRPAASLPQFPPLRSQPLPKYPLIPPHSYPQASSYSNGPRSQFPPRPLPSFQHAPLPRGMIPPRPPGSYHRLTQDSSSADSGWNLLNPAQSGAPRGTATLSHLLSLQRQAAQNMSTALKSAPASPASRPKE
jgi:hypothetical protein